MKLTFQNGVARLEEHPSIARRPQELCSTVPAKGRVLVVDDERPILDLMQEALTAEGYEVVTEGNGYRAIVRVRDQPFDLVFMDIKMPVNGVVAVKEILDIRPDAAIVMITGYVDDALIGEALSCGARMCLMKPFSMEEVLQVANHILREQQESQKHTETH